MQLLRRLVGLLLLPIFDGPSHRSIYKYLYVILNVHTSHGINDIKKKLRKRCIAMNHYGLQISVSSYDQSLYSPFLIAFKSFCLGPK